ncbi:MAG: DUF418 domain-containing protein [Alphaproteobacteria bacterium]|nr:DUF418 domain-containing protein [Alphaproteobacteria bacterium]
MTSPALAMPIVDNERADVLDALRSFALLGILISHVPGFSGYEWMTQGEQASLDRFGIDAPLAAVEEFLIRGKFFSLFSLLFGIGFAVQLESAMRRGADFSRHFTRRLAILFVIGMTHALIWYGDILKDYALIGLLLILTARWSAAASAWAAASVLIQRALWPWAVFALVSGLAPLKQDANPADDFFALARAFEGTDAAAMFAANLDLVGLKALQMIYDGKAVSVLGMFLLGAYIGKRRLYRDLGSNATTFRRVLYLAAPIGILGNVALVPLHGMTPDYPPSTMWAVEQSLFAIAVPAMTLAYASAFALAWQHWSGGLLRLLAPAGRMALTTYVSQTLICAGLFYGIGLGRLGTIGLAECFGVAIAIFTLQCVVSAMWLSLFRFGPLEWLWRRATYGVPLPMLRRPTLAA